ncbi:ggact.2 [Symbiodinium sp. CCMP2592]|nr:ggact.2 [Symbiodinium sp. CCMP2592]
MLFWALALYILFRCGCVLGFQEGRRALVAPPEAETSYLCPDDFADLPHWNSIFSAGDTWRHCWVGATPLGEYSTSTCAPTIGTTAFQKDNESILEVWVWESEQALRILLPSLRNALATCEKCLPAPERRTRLGRLGCLVCPAEPADAMARTGQPTGGKAEGKGKGKTTPVQAPAPSSADLPSAPTAATPSLPRKPAETQGPNVPPEKAQLEALVAALSAAGTSVPESVRALVAEHQQASAQGIARSLHRAVADQSRARAELQKVRVHRSQYLTSWRDYIDHITTLLEKQLTEQEEILDKYNAAEVDWISAEREATLAISRMASKDNAGLEEDQDMLDAEARTSDAAETEVKLRAEKEQQQKAGQELHAALQVARRQAEEHLSASKREGSRTPRRRTDSAEPVDVDLTNEGQSAQSGAAATPFKLGLCMRYWCLRFLFPDSGLSHGQDPLLRLYKLYRQAVPMTPPPWESRFPGRSADSADFKCNALPPPSEDRYVLFDTTSHASVRRLPAGWSLNDIVADIMGTLPQVRSVRFHTDRLPHLPAVQVTATLRAAEPGVFTTPLDLRSAEGRICTIDAPRACRPDLLQALCVHSCDPTRLPRGPFHLTVPDGSLAAIPAAGVPPFDFVRGIPGDHNPANDILAQDPAEGEEGDVAFLLQSHAGGPSSHTAKESPDLEGPTYCLPTECQGPLERPIIVPVNPPSLLSTAGPPRASLWADKNPSYKILPERWATPAALRIPAGQLNLYCASEEHPGAERRYALFDRQRHTSVRKAAADWTIEDYAADAVLNAPEPTAIFQVITVAIAGLPTPQFTLTPAGVPATSLTLPIDARHMGGPVLALLLRPGMPCSEVFDRIAAVFPASRYLVDLATPLDGLFLQDALGRVWEALPDDLSTLQWLTVRIDRAAFPGAPQFTPISAHSQWTGTTSTTTAMQPQVNVEHSIAEMLLIMARQGRMPRNPMISLCTAMPRNPERPNELLVGFMIYPSATEATDVAILQDFSTDGTMLQAITVDSGTRLEHMIGSAQARRGFTPVLNGVPRAAANRNLVTGDLVQVQLPPLTARVVTVAHMYFLLPELRLFAMPLSMPSMAPVTRNPLDPGAIERGREAARRTLHLRSLERRVEVGEPGHDNRPLLVMGPTHPPYLLFMPVPLEPSLREVLLFLSFSGFFDPVTSFAETRAFSHGVEIFVSIPPRSTRATVLLTAPDSTLTFLQLNMPVGMPLQNLGLPVRRGFELVLPAQAAHGAIIWDNGRRRPSSSASMGTEGTSLAQLPDMALKQAARCKQLRDIHEDLRHCPCVDGALQCPQDPPPDDSTPAASRPQEDSQEPDMQPPKVGLPQLQTVAIPTPFGRRRLCAEDAAPMTKTGTPGGSNTLTVQGPPDAPRQLRPHTAQSSPRAPQPATSVESVRISLADHIPPSPPAITWGVNHDILLHCLEDHGLTQFAMQPEAYTQRSMPLFYASGNAFPPGAPRATWAVVIVALQDGNIVRVGARAGAAQGPANHGPMHARLPSAFDGEIEAILHAFAVIASVPCRAAHVGADCDAALTVAQGLAATAEWDLTARATVSMRALIAMQSKGLFLHKVLAHAGCALNGLADALAKAVGKNPSLEAHGTFQPLWMAIAEGVVDHLWLVPRHPLTASSLPPLNDAGTWDRAYCSVVASDDLQRPFCMPAPDLEVKPVLLDLKVLQYNALSLKAPGAAELLAKGLRKHAVDIAGIQETRQRQTGITTVNDYWVLHAPCTDQGIGGAQIWVRHNPRWDRQAFTIVHQEPQILVVLGSFDGVKMLLVSAHAPPAPTAADVIQDWWGHLATTLHRTPATCVPLLFLDANATFSRQPLVPSTLLCSPLCNNAVCLQQFAATRALGLSPQFLANGAPLHSWVSPQGHRKLIDYIAMPADWECTCTVQDTPRLGDLYEDIDHQPVLLRLEATVDATPVQHRNRIDCRFWTLPASQQVASTVAHLSPPVPWTTRTTAHVDVLQQHLYHGVLSCVPAMPPKPRNPALTPETLDKGRPAFAIIRSEEGARICAAARWARQYRQGKELRRAMWTDKAEFTRRNYLKRGFCPSDNPVHPSDMGGVQGPDIVVPYGGLPAGDGRTGRVPRLWPVRWPGRFFAAAERAEPVAIEGLAGQGASEPVACQPLQGSDLPSLAGLASGFASLRTGRAAGLSGIASEAYRACPLQQALLYYPVACKLFLRDPSPFQWKGGLATCVPKPGKPCTQHKGYRAIMLLEGDNKALQKSMRPSLLKAMTHLSVPDQMGGRPGYALTQPSACVKAHLHRLRRTRQSGAVIFIDAAAAYYSIAKDLLSLTPAQRCDRTFLEQRATRLFQFEDLRQQFVQRMLDSNAELDEAMSPALRTYLQRQLDQTWYTAPGSPLADVMFSLVFGDLLRQTQAYLRERGWHSRLTAQAANTPGYTPTWADDVCILVEVGPAELVPAATADTLAFFLDRMHEAGLQANMGLGKTETILALYGPGSREVRRQYLSQTDPQLPYSSHYEQGHVRITAAYDHLGSTIQADGHSLPAIRRRRELARELYRPLKARVLRNPALTREEKIDLLRSRVIPRMMYGSGLWSVKTRQEEETLEGAINGFYRGSFQPIFGIKSQGYSSLELASALRMPTPAELLAVERLRAATQLARSDMLPVLEELSHDDKWWPAVTHAASEIGLLPPGEKTFPQIVEHLRAPHAITKAACRRFIRQRIEGRRVSWDDLKQREPCDTVTITAASGQALQWQCEKCPSAFADYRRLAVHTATKHGQRALHAVSAIGSRCEVCTGEYWTRQRLAVHLRRSPRCLRVYAEAEIQDVPEVHQPGSGAWRPCTISHGPRPWWATLNP